MFYVYHGYVSPDQCDASEGPIYKLTKCSLEDTVLRLKAEHDECVRGNGDVCYPRFVVIEGTRREVEAVKTVTEFRLKPRGAKQ